MSTAADLRDQGMEAADHGGVGNERQEWAAEFDVWFPRWAAEQGTFTNDDLRAALTRIGHMPPSSRQFGPAMKRALKAGVIVRVGVQPGTDPKHHVGWVSVYKAVTP
jgi:hypothetical protein